MVVIYIYIYNFRIILNKKTQNKAPSIISWALTNDWLRRNNQQSFLKKL